MLNRQTDPQQFLVLSSWRRQKYAGCQVLIIRSGRESDARRPEETHQHRRPESSEIGLSEQVVVSKQRCERRCHMGHCRVQQNSAIKILLEAAGQDTLLGIKFCHGVGCSVASSFQSGHHAVINQAPVCPGEPFPMKVECFHATKPTKRVEDILNLPQGCDVLNGHSSALLPEQLDQMKEVVPHGRLGAKRLQKRAVYDECRTLECYWL
jgi:hypothetical protein